MVDGEIGGEFGKDTIEKANDLAQQILVSKINAQSSPKDLSITHSLSLSPNLPQLLHPFSPTPLSRCLKLFLNLTQRHEGSTLDQLSARYFDYQLDKGVNFLPDCTYAGLFGKIAEDAGIRERVIFGKYVERIEYGDGGVRVGCADGTWYSAKKVVCSIPLGVLKSGRIKFQPQLPKQYADSISRLGLGLMNKIIVSFQSKFWGNYSWINIGCDKQNHFSQIYDFSKNGHNILCCFLTGTSAKNHQNLPQSQIFQNFLDFLSKYYEPSKIKPKSYIVTNWGKDSLCQASYSSFHVGSSPHDCYQLRKPIEKALWLVGEHCYGEYIGTAHGAFMTGKWAAEEVVKLLEEEDKEEEKQRI